MDGAYMSVKEHSLPICCVPRPLCRPSRFGVYSERHCTRSAFPCAGPSEESPPSSREDGGAADQLWEFNPTNHLRPGTRLAKTVGVIHPIPQRPP